MAERIADYLKKERVVRCLKWAALMHDIGKPVTKETRADKDGRVTFYGHDEVGRELLQEFADRAEMEQGGYRNGWWSHQLCICIRFTCVMCSGKSQFPKERR